jgi:hypothetical protein
VTVLSADGTVLVRRLADGAELRRGRIDRQIRGDDPATHTDLHADGGLLTVTETDAAGTTISAYRQESLTLLWRRTVRSEGVNPCGPLICLTDRRSITAIDPRTGAQRWVNDQWRWTGSSAAGYLVGTSTGGEDPDVGLIDPGTGRTVAAFGQVTLVNAGDWLVLRRERIPGRRIVLGARTVVSRLGPGTAGPVLGTVSGVVRQDCRGAGEYLACPTVLGLLTIHRVRRPGG